MDTMRRVALLRPFLAVARAGTLSAAARELGLSQPALTKSVRNLEQQFGVSLFDRRARGMTLTASGSALLAHARLIEAQCRAADAEIAALAHGEGGTVAIGAGPYWGSSLVPLAIARLQAQYPKVRVEVEVGVNSMTLPKLFAGELDVVISALPHAGTLPTGIETEDFGEFHHRVAAGRHHPLHRKRRVTARDLSRYGWVLYQHDRETLDRLARVLRDAGADAPDVRVVTTSLHAVMQLLKSGPYLACLADALLRVMPDRDIAVLPFRRDIWSFSSGATYHASLRSFAPLTALIDTLRVLSREQRRKGRFARVPTRRR